MSEFWASQGFAAEQHFSQESLPEVTQAPPSAPLAGATVSLKTQGEKRVVGWTGRR